MMHRFLSVCRAYAGVKCRPCIRLNGDWMYDFGFVNGALVQALPEPGGMDFILCNENIKSYSELFHTTHSDGGNFAQVHLSSRKQLEFFTSGQYVRNGNLNIGDSLVAKCEYGKIRVRKFDNSELGFGYAKTINTTQGTDNAGTFAPKIKLSGKWLNTVGFIKDSLVIVVFEQGCINFTLHDEKAAKYSELVKMARQKKIKLIQVNADRNRPFFSISGSFVENAGFEIGDCLVAYYRQGAIKLQKLDYEKLGF